MGFEFWALAYDSTMFALLVWSAAWGIDMWDARTRHHR